jgi:hypothetical protein
MQADPPLQNAAAYRSTQFDWKLFLACIVIASIVAVAQGQDASWDLLNYHYYVAHAFLHDRSLLDIAPAQVQTWHSPFADLPYYLMVQAGFPSVLFTAVLAIPAGVSVYMAIAIARFCAPARLTTPYIAAVVVLAFSGAAGARVMGTTMSEWHLVALILMAVLLVLISAESREKSARWLLLAGVLAGMSVGLKLTTAPFALALVAMGLTLPGSMTQRMMRVVWLGIGSAAGAALLWLPWAVEMYSRFGNPLFPYFNNVFESPSALPLPYRDERFGRLSWLTIAYLPIRLTWDSSMLVSEIWVRDPRVLLGFLSMIGLWLSRDKLPNYQQRILPLFVFFFVGYLLWAKVFGIYRYLGPVEMLACVFFILVLFTHVTSRVANRTSIASNVTTFVIVSALVVAVMTATKLPSWGRASHGSAVVKVEVPNLPPQSLVVIASLEPVSFITPNFRRDVPVISVLNNFMWPNRSDPMRERARARVNTHEGPVYRLVLSDRLDERHYDGSVIGEALVSWGWHTDTSACLPIPSQPMSSMALCRLKREPVTSSAR